MASFGGFYKGDKKKKGKRDMKKSNSPVISTAPIQIMPKMVERRRKKSE